MDPNKSPCKPPVSKTSKEFKPVPFKIAVPGITKKEGDAPRGEESVKKN